LGTGTSVSIGELFEMCCEVVGVRAEVTVDDPRIRPEGSEVMQLLSDPTQAAVMLGWKPEIDLHEGLRRTAGWMKDHNVSSPEQYRW